MEPASEITPRMAVAYHTVWNVTKDAITTREAVFPDRVTPPPTTDRYKKAPRSGVAEMSKYIMDGVWEGFEPPPIPEE